MSRRYKNWIFNLIYLLWLPLACKGNMTPVFSGTYPVILNKNEEGGTPGGTLLHTLTATDADSTDVITYTCTFIPSNSSTLFTYSNQTGQIYTATGTVLDYEQWQQYDIYCTATDGVAIGGPVLISVVVQNVAEAPYFIPSTTVQYFTLPESPSGTLIGHPSFTIGDEDMNEFHTWSKTGSGSGASYVYINPTNGTITLSQDYDRDTLSGTMDVQIKVTDKFGLSATATYSITFTDINDISPVFVSNYSFIAGVNTTVNTSFVTVSATDGDATSPNNEITYSIETTSTGREYFDFNGSNIYLQYSIDAEYGSLWTFRIFAIDGGTPANTATATVSVSTYSSTTTTTTTEPPPGYSWFSDNSLNVLMFVLAGVVLGVLTGYMCCMCWRYNTYGKCLHDQRTCCVVDRPEPTYPIVLVPPLATTLTTGRPFKDPYNCTPEPYSRMGDSTTRYSNVTPSNVTVTAVSPDIQANRNMLYSRHDDFPDTRY
ncbi:hypothetical protein ACJMK2_004545 [Sinanodonta woodiana]|uniref:Cadherin domain-containing protein n=1 Tax=Sinanodonta woodiana TaxID=1069815 RepID=A0ABD3Y1L4_SINWO